MRVVVEYLLQDDNGREERDDHWVQLVEMQVVREERRLNSL